MTPPTELSEVTITAPNAGWLATFTTDLLNNHLCASAHIDAIDSRYWWWDQVNIRSEYRAILHTRTDLVPLIIEAAKREHRYEVPCVMATPINSGNPDYIAWILAETESASPL